VFGDIDIDDCVIFANRPFYVVLDDISLVLVSHHRERGHKSPYQPAIVRFELICEWMRNAHDLRPATCLEIVSLQGVEYLRIMEYHDQRNSFVIIRTVLWSDARHFYSRNTNLARTWFSNDSEMVVL
jgi:hypothetical protein